MGVATYKWHEITPLLYTGTMTCVVSLTTREAQEKCVHFCITGKKWVLCLFLTFKKLTWRFRGRHFLIEFDGEEGIDAGALRCEFFESRELNDRMTTFSAGAETRQQLAITFCVSWYDDRPLNTSRRARFSMPLPCGLQLPSVQWQREGLR